MEEHAAAQVAELMLQVALVLCAARLGGELAERWLRQPAVLGELAAGMAVGPFALGGLHVPGLGPMFPLHQGFVAVSPELYALAQLGSVILLFVAGLETDLRTFLRFGPNATLVALGGVVLPFALGAGGAVAVGFADGVLDPHALFMGAILTATSVGITARVLGDIGKLDTPEGVTILGAAVIDDVLGILVLALVVSVGAGDASAGGLGLIAGKAIGAWLLLSGGFLLFASAISRIALRLRVEGAGLAIALAAGLIGAYLADLAGLALIIGAYSAGLALSPTHLKVQLEREIRVVYSVFVPIFFVVIGMLVDLQVLVGALGVGILLTVLACLGKVVGCGLPAALVGFTRRGAVRVGLGMMPRGEVALVVAGVGLTAGLVTQEVFAAAVFVAVATTLVAPPFLVPSFRGGGEGLRRVAAPPPAPSGSGEERESRRFEWTLSHAAASLLAQALHRHLVEEAGFDALLGMDVPHERVAQYRRDGAILSVEVRDQGEGRGSLHVEVAGVPEAEDIAERALDAARRSAAREVLGSLDLGGEPPGGDAGRSSPE